MSDCYKFKKFAYNIISILFNNQKKPIIDIDILEFIDKRLIVTTYTNYLNTLSSSNKLLIPSVTFLCKMFVLR